MSAQSIFIILSETPISSWMAIHMSFYAKTMKLPKSIFISKPYLIKYTFGLSRAALKHLHFPIFVLMFMPDQLSFDWNLIILLELFSKEKYSPIAPHWIEESATDSRQYSTFIIKISPRASMERERLPAEHPKSKQYKIHFFAQSPPSSSCQCNHNCPSTTITLYSELSSFISIVFNTTPLPSPPKTASSYCSCWMPQIASCIIWLRMRPKLDVLNGNVNASFREN